MCTTRKRSTARFNPCVRLESDMRKSIREFIKENRAELDACIRQVVPNITTLNDEERRQWVLNDEGLYMWARREGVRI